MIIKRQQHKLSQAAQEASLSLETRNEEKAPPLEWSEEAVKSGLLPERRSENRTSDRRRGYRRVEDQMLISKAHEEANAIREQAYEEGFQEGLVRAETVISELRDAIERLMNAREEALLSVTSEIASIAVEVAARIIKTEVSCDESLVMGLVRDTIQKAGRQSKSILIKLNPDDVAVVKRMLKDEPIPNLDAELIVMDDPAVDAGSCIIETNSGLIDASFSTQLGILRQLFNGGAA
ncbi:MAG TPA: FliH/SctL family protein [Oculatellaceae cyanobacterium]|jgi:flagellar assembly protein FliH